MLGNIAGELAVDALSTKGAGKVAKLSKTAEPLRCAKIGERIANEADDAKKRNFAFAFRLFLLISPLAKIPLLPKTLE